MNDILLEANEEMKRVDHLIFVSLKYTRTVDVIISVLQRMVEAMERMIDLHLTKMVDSGKIDQVPNAPAEKTNLMKKLFPDNKQLSSLVEFYLLIRKVLRSKYTKSTEFRRHVTMSVTLDGMKEPLDIHIDRVNEYHEKLKDFFRYAVEEAQNEKE
jgi:hypothetical protein